MSNISKSYVIRTNHGSVTDKSKSNKTAQDKTLASNLADAELLRFIALLADKDLINMGSIFATVANRPLHAPIPLNAANGDLLTTSQAANYLNLSPKTLANWRVTGGGPRFSKIGGRVCYAKSSLEAFIDANLRQSTSDKGNNDHV